MVRTSAVSPRLFFFRVPTILSDFSVQVFTSCIDKNQLSAVKFLLDFSIGAQPLALFLIVAFVLALNYVHKIFAECICKRSVVHIIFSKYFARFFFTYTPAIHLHGHKSQSNNVLDS